LVTSGDLVGQGGIIKGISKERDVLGVDFRHDVPGFIVVILSVVLCPAAKAVFVTQRGGPVDFFGNYGEILGKIFVEADEIDSQSFIDADEMILREEVGKAPDALPCEPLPDERVEIVVCREISSGEPPVAFQVALFQEEKSGNEAVPRVSDKGKLEASIEHLLRISGCARTCTFLRQSAPESGESDEGDGFGTRRVSDGVEMAKGLQAACFGYRDGLKWRY
jgi:hypothetical protein